MPVVLVVRQVDDFPHLEPLLGIEPVDDIQAPLAAAVFRLHGVQDDGAVRVKADPVVGEHGVRGMRLVRVVEHEYLDTCITQGRHQALELRQGCLLLLGGRSVRFRLECVRLQRLRIALEARRPDHEDARCQL